MRGGPDVRPARLASGAAAVGVELDADGARRLVAYLDLLYHANRTVNLTRVEAEAALELHAVDSLAALRILRGSQLHVVDVGSGAGFPGVALAAARPAWRVTVVDSVRKKVRFVDEAAAGAGIANVTGVWGRAEDLGRSARYRERFDVAVARALAALPVLLELTIPLVRPGGRVVAYKGGDVEAELGAAGPALEVLGGVLEAVDRFRLPWSGASRSLVVIVKTRATPARYPRRPGVPARRPLGGHVGAGGKDAPGRRRSQAATGRRHGR